jgi:hypothetical protein
MRARMTYNSMILSYHNVEQALTQGPLINDKARYETTLTDETYDGYVYRQWLDLVTRQLGTCNHFTTMPALNLTAGQRAQLAKLASNGSELLLVLEEIRVNAAKGENINLIPELTAMLETLAKTLSRSPQEMFPQDETGYRATLLATLKKQAKAISQNLQPSIGARLQGALSIFVACVTIAAPIAIAVISFLSGSIAIAAVATLAGILLWSGSNKLGSYGYRLFDGWKSKTINNFADSVDVGTQATLSNAQAQHLRLALY